MSDTMDSFAQKIGVNVSTTRALYHTRNPLSGKSRIQGGDYMKGKKIIQQTIREVSYDDWPYFDEADLHIEDPPIHLKYVARMTDPVAMFRPQILRSWYGSGTYGGETYPVFVVLGTDDGLSECVCIEVGTLEELRTLMDSDMFRAIEPIIPVELMAP